MLTNTYSDTGHCIHAIVLPLTDHASITLSLGLLTLTSSSVCLTFSEDRFNALEPPPRRGNKHCGSNGESWHGSCPCAAGRFFLCPAVVGGHAVAAAVAVAVAVQGHVA